MTKNHQKIHHEFYRRGAISLIAVFFVTLFGVMSISFFYISNLNVQMARNHRDIVRAYAMSESGLEYAQWLISRYLEDVAPYTNNQILTQENMEDMFADFSDYIAECLNGSVAVQGQTIGSYQSFSEQGLSGLELQMPAIQADAATPGQYTLRFRQYDHQPETLVITSTGTSADLNRTVQLDFAIEIQPAGLFEYAIYARDSIALNQGVTVNGYNFEPGDAPLKIGSASIDAGAIALNADVTVQGDVEVAPTGEPDTVVYYGNGASVTGDVYVRDQDWQMPIVAVPTALESAFSEGSINESDTISSSGKYESIDLGKNDVLYIDGNVQLYVTGDIHLGQAARIEINTENPNARLTLYLGGNLVGEKDAALNNPSSDATRMLILGLDSCEQFTLNNSGLVYGAIYVPDANVYFNHLVELYGSVAGRNFDQSNGADVHYDANLRNATVEGVSSDINIACQPNSYVEM